MYEVFVVSADFYRMEKVLMSSYDDKDIDENTSGSSGIGVSTASLICDITPNELIRTVTDDYLSSLNPDDDILPSQIEKELLNIVRQRILVENQTRIKSDKIKIPQHLSPHQIAKILFRMYHIVNVNCTSSLFDDCMFLAMYQESGDNAGLYIWNDLKIRKLIQEFNYNISTKEIDETIELLKINAPIVERTTDKNLIPCNNGIFNFETKQLEPFSPEYVFLSKSRVNYNPLAQNVFIPMPDGEIWDVESWVADLFDDPELEQLIWEVLSAIVRPYNRWKKVIWLYADTGNNGKGTICELARSLVGNGSYTSIPVSKFSDRFVLEPLLHATAIINDENSSAFIESSDVFKAIATNDVVSIERKYKPPINYQFFGLQIQCTNELVRFKDKTDSLYRRQLMIPFEKTFTGIERPYIKMDYLHRPEVLEYVLYKVLNMDFDVLSEPAACRRLLDEYKIDNDPVRQFWDELREEFTWGVLPSKFVFDLYCGWMHKNIPNGKIQSRQSFKKDIKAILRNDDMWCISNKKIRVKPYISAPEPLILEYNLNDWKNAKYMGGDIDKICTTSYEGVVECIMRSDVKLDDADGE